MKLLILIGASLLAFNAAADNEFYNDQERDRDRALYASMSDEAALTSNEFDRITFNIYLRDSSTWFAPSGLCRNGDRIQTKTPVRTGCAMYEGRNDDNELIRISDYFTARSAFDTNFPTCVAPITDIVWAPINYTTSECVKWTWNEDGDSKTTRDRRVARNNSARCVERGTRAHTTPTAATVSFFTGPGRHNPSDRAGRDFLGERTYALPSCNAQPLPPMPAF